jgi:peptide chain release factor 2
MAQPGFWESSEKAQEVIAEVKRLKKQLDPVREIGSTVSELHELAQMANESSDASSFEELSKKTDAVEVKLEDVELKATLNEPHDNVDAFLSIHAGAGGTEACDWVRMLARMYTRFCERNGFEMHEVDLVPGEEVGVRGITYQVKGPYAYGLPQVRSWSPSARADLAVRRQKPAADLVSRPSTWSRTCQRTTRTSPSIPPRSAWTRFARAGPVWQHVNKTDSAVRITHLATAHRRPVPERAIAAFQPCDRE